MKKTLIIAFTFPPSPGIGGRRWAKFAKYLFKANVNLEIIASKNNGKGISSWVSDINSFKNRISYISSGYPKYLRIIPTSIFEKILYKISLIYVKCFVRGNYYDYSSFYKKTLLKEVETKINNGFHNIIVSGGPFNQVHIVSLLKKKYPFIKLISDFRDPWYTANIPMHRNLNKKRLKYEKLKEEDAMKFSDYILVPVLKMMSDLKETYPNFSKKIIFIPHAFDKDDFSNITKKEIKKKHKINLIYGGTVYDGLCAHFEEVKKVLEKHHDKIELSFYISNPESVPIGIKQYVKIYNPLQVNLYYKKVAEIDFYLVMFPDKTKDFLSTKFYEIIYLRKPIIFIGAKGYVSDFITKNNLGLHFEIIEIEKGFEKILLNQNFIYNKNYDIEKFSFQNVTKQLLSLIS